MVQSFDVVVIGAGPGGYVAAIRCSQLGLKVAIVEREHLGGICLNWGCIPTKALLKASELYHDISHASDFGLNVGKVDVDITKLVQRSRDVAGKLNGGIGYLMKKNKVTVVDGAAVFKDKNTLEITKKDNSKEVITFKNAVIATGARPRQIAGVMEADGTRIWTSREAMVPKTLPKSLLVIGAGAIGIEFASFYATLGTQVTVIEAQDRVLPVEDAEISKLLHKALEKDGIVFKLSTKVQKLTPTKTGVEAVIEQGGKTETLSAENAILAIGVVGNTEGLGLESIGVKVEKGAVAHNEYFQTAVPHIYAIGDVAGAPWLAHVASHEGVIAAEHIAHTLLKKPKPHGMDYTNVPGCTYCRPQVASVGFTEAQAKEKGHTVKVGRYSYQANGKAIALGAPEGLVKTIFDAKTGQLLGAHIIGAEATEMISFFILGKQLETTEAEIIHACLPHPTLSEMLGESVLDSEGRVVNA